MRNYSIDDVCSLPRFGLVVFDNPDDAKNGVASLSGESAFPIRGVGDLQSDAIWISNLNYHQMSENNLHSNPKLRRYDFLRTDIYRIAKEMGLNIHSLIDIKVMSEIIDRVMRLGHQHYKFPEIKDTLKNTVNDCLFSSLMDVGGNGSPSLDQFMSEAFLPYQKCYGKVSTNSQIAQFRFSREFYANAILKCPVPSGSWRMLTDFPRKGKAKQCKSGPVYQFLTTYGDNKPLLCEVSVSNIDPMYAELLDFGNGTTRRNWIPGHEAALLASYGDVELKRVIECESFHLLSDFDPLLMPPNHGVPGELSFSSGLLAENHWLALASARTLDLYGTSRQVISSRAAWLRAWDRMICLKAALKFKDAGYVITSYGIGAVNVALPQNHFSAAVEFASNIGLSAPFWLITNEKTDEEMGASDRAMRAMKNKLHIA